MFTTTVTENGIKLSMPFTEANFNTYTEERFKKWGLDAKVSIVSKHDAVSKMVGGNIYESDSENVSLTVPYRSFYNRMKYLTSTFGKTPSDSEREGLFMRTFKEIPVAINRIYEKIKSKMDDLGTTNLSENNITVRPTELRDVYDNKNIKDDTDKELFEIKPVEVENPPSVPTRDDLPIEKIPQETTIEVKMLWVLLLWGSVEYSEYEMDNLNESVRYWGVLGVLGVEDVGEVKVIEMCKEGVIIYVCCGSRTGLERYLRERCGLNNELYKRVERNIRKSDKGKSVVK